LDALSISPVGSFRSRTTKPEPTMPSLSFASYPLWLNLVVFAAAAAFVWVAGTRLARHADEVSRITGLGQALVGAVLMAGVTSLPELATVVTASLSGSAALAVNNMLGGVAFQVTVLAVGDAVCRRRALSAVVPDPGVMLQAALGIGLLAVVAAGIIVGELQILGVGLWSALVALLYGLAMVLLAGERTARAWRPADKGWAAPQEKPTESLTRALLFIALTGAVILVAGVILTKTSEALAEQTGLGASFVGVLLLALSTSLPEISGVIAAVRRRRPEMAYGDILGTNLFDIVLIFLADLLYGGPPVLGEVGRFSAFAALLAIVVTAIALVGLLERRDTTVARVGVDSIAILVVYLGGVVVLYQLR
jgi:cation:H+ antiporter